MCLYYSKICLYYIWKYLVCIYSKNAFVLLMISTIIIIYTISVPEYNYRTVLHFSTLSLTKAKFSPYFFSASSSFNHRLGLGLGLVAN